MIEIAGVRYYQRADGSLLPESLVKEEDKLKDNLVNELCVEQLLNLVLYQTAFYTCKRLGVLIDNAL